MPHPIKRSHSLKKNLRSNLMVSQLMVSKRIQKGVFGLALWHINHYRLFNAKSIFIHINSSISNNSV